MAKKKTIRKKARKAPLAAKRKPLKKAAAKVQLKRRAAKRPAPAKRAIKAKRPAKKTSNSRRNVRKSPFIARKPESFKLEPMEKFEKPIRSLPPMQIPQPAVVADVRKRKSMPRALTAVLASGAIAVVLLAIFTILLSVDFVPALILSLVLFAAFGILIYNFLEASG